VLEDGRAIGLDTVGDGAFTRQGNVKVVKLDSGKIAYTNLPDKAAKVVYNTLATPKGGQYGLVLPDGTRVWLNAASSLRFPTAFTGRERRVELKGEGYFEVAGDKSRPFTVQVRDGMEVEVLGTHFNIMSYEDEPAVRTSLLEGMVRVTEGGTGRLVRPGQQAEWSPGGEVIVHDADVGDAVAWKNGFFQFHIASIEEVLRQLSRWYDIEIQFEGKKPEGHFEGEISRSNSLADVLRMLAVNGLRFRLKGRTLIVQ
jgi:ferric-dicitrate binding protein FerR (iron transport regulator)